MRTRLLLPIAALPLIACAHGAAYDAQTTTTSGNVIAGRFDDPQIAEILRAALTAAVEESSVSAPCAPDPNVAEYANVMHEQYRLALEAERTIIEDAHVVPQPSEASRTITFDSEAVEWRLLGQAGTDIERAFLGREVTFQRNLLSVIDNDLLPSVRGDEQRREILRLRPVVARLLGEASQLQASILAH
jgi:hypothetical protein